MEQDKRVIIAFALSFLMLVAWRVFFVKPASKPAQPPAAATAPKATPTPPVPGETPANPGPAAVHGKVAAEIPHVAASPALPVQEGTGATDIVVQTDLYKVTFSTQGAVVKSWVLKKYKDENGEPLELVNQEACATIGYPMSLVVSDPNQSLKANTELNEKIQSAIFVSHAGKASSTVTANEKHLPNEPALSSPFTAPINLEFTYSDGAVLVKKVFSFGSGYVLQVNVSASTGQRDYPVGVQWPGGFGDNSLEFKLREARRFAVYGTPESITLAAPAKVSEDQAVPAPLGLVGLEDKFFAEVFLPVSESASFSPKVGFRFTRHEWKPKDWKEKEFPQPLTALLSSSDPQPLAFRLFVGPKSLDVLGSVKPSIEGLVSYGWFTVVAKPLFLGMRYIYENWVHNYGWAIIILTLFINLATFPLRVKSVRSAQNMQKIAPLVKDIQDRYKQYKFNDPRKQRMNQEVMDLYKKHHVNPMGGCLPMALQLPILYGFYRVLDQAIELRHAPWILWVKDLSAVDYWHLFGFSIPALTTIMVVTMYFQTKITPQATTDPSQARMMMMMPIFMGALFYVYALPSGLMLYYSAANIVGIGQQLFINKTMPVQPLVPPPRKAGEEKDNA